MSIPQLSAREAHELYTLWLERVEERVRTAYAKVHGRRDRHASDLADLKRDLVSVNLRPLLEPEYVPMPGTPLHAAVNARMFLEDAEQYFTCDSPKLAIVKLQLAYESARIAIKLLDEAVTGLVAVLPPSSPAPGMPTFDSGEPDGGWFVSIPGQRH
ncbi:hypothetical protein [Actinospica robiniae]|uniref:hypothetical protein n=1 Tax=Actinospica robiniae TaxID=304901 RepID=UPI00041F6942|nr:hypothetical protein [Actinospica robiniae]